MLKKPLTIVDFLDRALKVQGLDSDRALGRALEYKGPIVTRMRHKGVLPSPSKMMLLADLIGMEHHEALTWLSYWEAEKRKEPAVAGIWMHAIKVMDKARKSAAVIAILLMPLLSNPFPSAHEQIEYKSQEQSFLLYIMRQTMERCSDFSFCSREHPPPKYATITARLAAFGVWSA